MGQGLGKHFVQTYNLIDDKQMKKSIEILNKNWKTNVSDFYKRNVFKEAELTLKQKKWCCFKNEIIIAFPRQKGFSIRNLQYMKSFYMEFFI